MGNRIDNLTIKIARLGYSASHRIRFYRKVATLMRNGKQLITSIENLQKRAARRGKTDVEAVALNEILQGLRQGKSFADAIQHYASVNERMVLEAGENSGDLPNALDLSAEILDASSQMKSKVLGAIISPLFLISMLIGILFLLARVVIPKLTAVLCPEQWEAPARLLYKVTQVVNSHWMLLVLFLLIAALVGIGLSLSRWSGKGRAAFDRIPPWSMFRLLIGSGWLMSLASLIKSGETVLNSLQKMQRVSKKNKWLYDRLGRAVFFYSSGLNLGEALEATKQCFPDRDIVDDLVVYADMEGFDDILHSLGREWAEKGLEKIKQQAGILNTAAITLVGLLLGWFTYAVVSIQMSMGTHFTGM